MFDSTAVFDALESETEAKRWEFLLSNLNKVQLISMFSFKLPFLLRYPKSFRRKIQYDQSRL